MNERIVRVLLSVRVSMGERILLLLLLGEGIPRRAAEAPLSEELLRAQAAELARTHFLDADMTYRGLLTWQHVMRADEKTARSGRVDEDFLRALESRAACPAERPEQRHRFQARPHSRNHPVSRAAAVAGTVAAHRR